MGKQRLNRKRVRQACPTGQVPGVHELDILSHTGKKKIRRHSSSASQAVSQVWARVRWGAWRRIRRKRRREMGGVEGCDMLMGGRGG